jgi:hypothetical protein
VHVVRATAGITLSEFVVLAVDGSFVAAKEYERLKRVVMMRKINGQDFKGSTACHCRLFFFQPHKVCYTVWGIIYGCLSHFFYLFPASGQNISKDYVSISGQ